MVLRALHPWVRSLRRVPCRRSRPTPRLEYLEDRSVPSTFTVVNLDDAGLGSGLEGDLRYAINTANANDELSNQIVFAPDLAGTITLTQRALAITKELEIVGPGESRLTVSGNHQSGVFQVTAASGDQNIRLSGLTIADGVGVLVGSTPYGGGFYNAAATVTLTDVAVTGNMVASTGDGGGIYNDTGALTLNDCTVSGNSVDDGGLGGGIYDARGSLLLNSCTIADNSVGLPGGNVNNSGGGIATAGLPGSAPVMLNRCTISGNSAAGTYAIGGGIDNQGHGLILDHCTLVNNTADNLGGGLANIGATTALTECVISGNSAFRGGGGLDNDNGRVTLTDSTIADNSSSPSNGFGGGIFNNSQMTLAGCTLSGNSAYGGGGILQNAGTLSLTNCTLSSNTAAQAGGGIYANQGALGILQLTSVTVAANSADGVSGFDRGGGGLWLYPPGILTPNRVYLHDTLVAGNSTASLGPDINGTVLSMGFNLIGQADDSQGWGTTDLTGTSSNPLDPRLGPLQDNGGPTLTHAVLVGSPAIAAGDLALRETLDQRGTDRVGSHPPDIGAFQAERIFSFQVTAPSQAAPGEAFTVTVTALDFDGHTASTFVGGVGFTSTDPDGVLPNNYIFTPQDGGVHTFIVTLQAPGPQTIQATDLGNPFHTGSATVTVEAPLPPRGASAPADEIGSWEINLPGFGLEPWNRWPAGWGVNGCSEYGLHGSADLSAPTGAVE